MFMWAALTWAQWDTIRGSPLAKNALEILPVLHLGLLVPLNTALKNIKKTNGVPGVESSSYDFEFRLYGAASVSYMVNNVSPSVAVNLALTLMIGYSMLFIGGPLDHKDRAVTHYFPPLVKTANAVSAVIRFYSDPTNTAVVALSFYTFSLLESYDQLPRTLKMIYNLGLNAANTSLDIVDVMGLYCGLSEN